MKGSTYITWWLYKLPQVFGNTAVDILSEGAGYAFQALGILLFSLLMKRSSRAALSKTTFAGILVADGAVVAMTFLSSTAYGILGFGFLMNLLHGAIAAYYLTRLSQLVPQQKRGLTFGLGYAFGSVGSWALSLPMKGTFLGSPYVFIAYAAMLAAMLFIDRLYEPIASDEPETEPAARNQRNSLVPLAAAVVVLLSAVKGIGFYFPTVDHLGGVVNAVSMRAFYAIGLIAAGIINDRNRKTGAVCCLAALIFPFITFALSGRPAVGVILWIAGYIFFGFFTVYRTVTFADLAGKKSGLLPVAGFGLLFGRLGDAAGAVGGVVMGANFTLLLTVSSVVFVLTILVFFRYYNKVYTAVLPQEQNMEALLDSFESRYQFTARQREIFRLVVKGCSNAEISSELFLAESTVKFHMKNILKLTGTANRTELVAAFKAGQRF